MAVETEDKPGLLKAKLSSNPSAARSLRRNLFGILGDFCVNFRYRVFADVIFKLTGYAFGRGHESLLLFRSQAGNNHAGFFQSLDGLGVNFAVVLALPDAGFLA